MAGEELREREPGSIQRITPGTQLLVSLGGLDERLKTVFVGLERGRHFMFRTPRRTLGQGVYDYLYAGNRAIVRFLSRGHIWAFDTTIQTYTVKPHPLVFADYPQAVQTHSLRKEHRIDCFFPATLVQEHSTWEAMVQDLSRTGCGLVFESGLVERTPELGDSLLLECPLFGAVGADRLRCDVRRVIRNGDTVDLGVTFLDLAEPVDRWIRDYVAQVLGIIDR